jgi:uncharacterized membrane protein YjjP (DUF1212 family)
MEKNNMKNIFVGENKYTTGLIFLFATLMGFFTHLRKLNFEDRNIFCIIGLIAIFSCFVSKF